ncbi:gamma-glutamylcyclotransferase [Mucilaginibacter limnophilus]|uniref:Gamma-glutamylcyclotransferase n=1 Tax=Mucilaginibacter limnophilus TaxID=1932778 RepID=A0A3S2Y5V9_9SPHI|nr:gamma-glutamylcyclotransferase family protein [Mucilaginibacter limnophilus]RVU02810.1 gamma-glutamylcyclotransferase [Mucilaginibacter limnophilus]
MLNYGMTAENNLLFVYGTLLVADNEFALYMNKHAVLYKTGRFKGHLYDLGSYPGAVLHNESEVFVHGSIYQIQNPEAWTILDEYEGISPAEPHPQQYVREQVDIETDEGLIKSWIYLYNWPVTQHKLIESGSYLQYLKLL